jgi:hypothetical protein
MEALPFPDPERVYDRNPHNYNRKREGGYIEGDHFYTKSRLHERAGRNYFEIFVDWINAPGNGQNVFKGLKQTIELGQECFQRMGNSATLTNLGSLFGKLREGHAPLYWLKCTKDLFFPSEGAVCPSLCDPAAVRERVKAAFEWGTATFLNIGIFAPSFGYTASWTGPGMTCTSLVTDSIELYDGVNGLSGRPADERNPALLKVIGLTLAVAIGAIGVISLVFATPIPAILLLSAALLATVMKLSGSFWEYSREPVFAT